MQPASTLAVGRLAEALAASYLRLRGYAILEQNVRLGPREIDLVAVRDGWLIMVEVRYRRDDRRGLPEESIHAGKQVHLLRAGKTYWLERGRIHGRLRFDLICLTLRPDGLVLRHHPHFLRPNEHGVRGRR